MGLQDRDYYKEHHKKLKNKESNLKSQNKKLPGQCYLKH